MVSLAKSKIAVIGAGVAGVTAAYWLARDGASVTIYESERHPGMGTSRANGSQLSVCNSATWNTWPTILKGMKWMFQKDAPFYINPWPSPDKIAWLARFAAVAARRESSANTYKTIKMALDSRNALAEIVRAEGIVFDHVRRGIMHVYTSRSSLALASEMGNLMRSAGCDWQVIGPKEALELEPSLAAGPSIAGAVMTSDDSTGDLHLFTVGLASSLSKHHGVELRTGSPVGKIIPSKHGVVIDGEAYSDVVIASGTKANSMASLFGDRLGIYPVKGYSITIDLESPEDQQQAPWVSLLDEDAKIVCARLGSSRLRVAGTAELAGHDLDIRSHRIKPLLSWTNRWFPGISTRSHCPWAGLRPMTPSMMPVVGRSRKEPHVWYHAGHGHLGWTLAPGTGRTLAQMMRDGSC